MQDYSRFLSRNLFIFLFACLLIISCREKQAKFFSRDKEHFNAVSCFELYPDQMTKWVNNGWTTPGNANKIEWLAFIPSASFEEIDVTEVSVYPLKADFSQLNLPRQLRVQTRCAANIENLTYARNYVDFDALNLCDGEGDLLTDWSFIRLEPVYVAGQALTFDVKVISKTGETETSVREAMRANPCPPTVYCPTDRIKTNLTDTTNKPKDTTKVKDSIN